MKINPELHPERYGGDGIYETKKVARAWHTTEEYRGWLLITIEKYCSRYGKKDDRLKEAQKIETYARFLRELEEEELERVKPVEGNPKGPHLYEEKILNMSPKEYKEQYSGIPVIGECEHPSQERRKLTPIDDIELGEECLDNLKRSDKNWGGKYKEN